MKSLFQHSSWSSDFFSFSTLTLWWLVGDIETLLLILARVDTDYFICLLLIWDFLQEPEILVLRSCLFLPLGTLVSVIQLQVCAVYQLSLVTCFWGRVLFCVSVLFPYIVSRECSISLFPRTLCRQIVWRLIQVGVMESIMETAAWPHYSVERNTCPSNVTGRSVS